MIRIYALVVAICYSLTLSAQEEFYQPTAEDQAYREFRSRTSIPPYGLNKIKQLIKTIKGEASEYGDGGIEALTANQFKSLDLREKFTYVMIHPEVYAQNCAIFIPIPTENKKVFSHLISWMNESDWSDRQILFMRENKDSVLSIIKESTMRSGHMGVNYKDAIELLDGWEMIPFLIDYYKNKPKDKDVLTLLLLLMKQGQYAPFLTSSSYQKLYGNDYNYESYIISNQANEDLIIKRAQGYYHEKQH